MYTLSKNYLSVNGNVLPVLRDSYQVSYRDVVTDDSGVTEAGTTIRNTSRRCIPSISVTFTATETLLSTLAGYYKNAVSVSVIFWDAGALSDAWTMYIDNFSFKLLGDDGNNSVFEVSMTLEDLKDVSDI